MFNPGVIRQLAKDHYQTFMKLQAVEKRLKARFADMDEVVDALILSVTSGEPLLLVGPPGTGKSRLIRAFCGLTGLLDEDDPGAKENGDYFEYLRTPFTEPGELFVRIVPSGQTDLSLWEGTVIAVDDGPPLLVDLTRHDFLPQLKNWLEA